MFADLHTHTTASDGVISPKDLVQLAKQANLRAVAITDHDAVFGIPEAIEAGKEIGIEVIPGIEISTIDKRQDIHVLGYYIEYRNADFLKKLADLQNVRKRRNEMMVEKLQSLGIDISLKEVKKKKSGEDGNIGRPHIAEVLLDKGYVSSMEEAFTKYLGKNGIAYVNPPRISPEEAVDIIKEYHGVPVLAHPGLYNDSELVERLIRYGISGIEVFHPDHDEKLEKYYYDLAVKHKLLITGGSDFHGVRNGEIFHAPLGGKKVGYDVVEKLKYLAKKN